MGLELLKSKNIPFKVKEYLTEKLTVDELLSLFKALKKTPQEIVRKKEDLYKELELENKNYSNEQWAQIIVDNPKLLERPILVLNGNAVIGRPTENLETIL